MIPLPEALTGFLILAGAVLLVTAFRSTRKLLAHVETSKRHRGWRLVLGLMAFFVAGYLGALALVVLGRTDWLQLLTGVVFFFGALFVLLVVRMGEATVADLQRQVTQRRQVEAELKTAKEAAEAAYQAKSSFLANMSHELRTPLNAVLGYAEMLEEDLAGAVGPESIEDLQRIQKAGRHLLKLIEDVLEMARIEAGRLELLVSEVDVGDVVSTVAALHQREAAQKGLSFQVETEPGLPRLQTDGPKLHAVLDNLIDNAIRFTETGGVSVKAGLEGDEVVLRVADTGIGLSQDQVTRAFQAFTQVDASTTRKRDGAGLGLAINERYLAKLGGRIGVVSQLGEGSTFSVHLPIG